GRVIAFGGRAMAPDAKPKYLNSSDTPLFHKGRVLYRYKAAREALGHGEGGGLIVCEGYMDVIALCEAGFGHAVAPLGTALTEDQLGLLWRAGPEPLLCFDGDSAGLRAAYRSIDRALPFLNPGQSLFFCLLEDGLDPDDFIKAFGRSAMAEKLAQGVPLSQLLWQRERDREQVDTPERKAGLEERLKAAASQIQNGAVKAAYDRDLRGRMNDYFWDLRQQARSNGQKGSFGRPNYQSKSQSGQLKPAKTRGLGLIIRAIDNPHLAERGAEDLAHAIWSDPDVTAICDAVLASVDSSTPLDREVIRDNLDNLGKTRAVKLLIEYPEAAPIDPDGAGAREWLIALEQYTDSSEDGEDEADFPRDGATMSAAEWKLHHKRVAERQVRRNRITEAAEKADQD
ncbi:MAG: toprim domain-containing protein, partial [Pseudomonadota bacterium]